MNTEWELTRTWSATDDAQRRWDAAYQLLLRVAREAESAPALNPHLHPRSTDHEDRPLCSGLDPKPNSHPDH